MELALLDPSEIVRYWASRTYYFHETTLDFGVTTGNIPWESKPAAPEEVARSVAARNDPSELVRMSINRGSFRVNETLAKMSHLERLLYIRNNQHLAFVSFIDWLDEGVVNGLPDLDACECAMEFFGRADTKTDLQSVEFSDGTTEYVEGEALKKAWALLKGKAGPTLGHCLASHLPIRRGFFEIDAEQLTTLPDKHLEVVLLRRGEHATFEKLVALIRREPQRFSEDLCKSLRDDEEGDWFGKSGEERSVYRWVHAIDRSAANTELLLAIRSELQQVRTQLDELEKAATSHKRRFFG